MNSSSGRQEHSRSPGAQRSLGDLLQDTRPQLVSFLRRKAGILLQRFDSVEDLVQGVHTKAISAADSFEWRGREAFLGWLFQIASNHLSSRREYWFALKRRSADVLRLSLGSDSRTGIEPAGTQTGPATRAGRREYLVLATRALSLLGDRDRTMIEWTTVGVSLDEQATRLKLSYQAAATARARAVDRLRQMFELMRSASEESP